MAKKINKWLRSLCRNEQGQAITETALSIMTFLLLILGIMQMALIFNGKFLTNYAAYCAARAAITSNENLNSMRAEARDAACVALSPNYSNSILISYNRARIAFMTREIDVEIIDGDNFNYNERFFNSHNAIVTVRVTHWFTMIIPYVNRVISSLGGRISWDGRHQIRLVSTYTMRLQSDSIFND